MLEPLLTTEQAARLLALEPQTLRIWRVTGKGPSFTKLGHEKQSRIRYAQSEINKWLIANQF